MAALPDDLDNMLLTVTPNGTNGREHGENDPPWQIQSRRGGARRLRRFTIRSPKMNRFHYAIWMVKRPEGCLKAALRRDR
jgi:hypothetical protein